MVKIDVTTTTSLKRQVTRKNAALWLVGINAGAICLQHNDTSRCCTQIRQMEFGTKITNDTLNGVCNNSQKKNEQKFWPPPTLYSWEMAGAQEGRVRKVETKIWSWGQKLHMAFMKNYYFLWCLITCAFFIRIYVPSPLWCINNQHDIEGWD